MASISMKTLKSDHTIKAVRAFLYGTPMATLTAEFKRSKSTINDYARKYVRIMLNEYADKDGFVDLTEQYGIPKTNILFDPVSLAWVLDNRVGLYNLMRDYTAPPPAEGDDLAEEEEDRSQPVATYEDTGEPDGPAENDDSGPLEEKKDGDTDAPEDVVNLSMDTAMIHIEKAAFICRMNGVTLRWAILDTP